MFTRTYHWALSSASHKWTQLTSLFMAERLLVLYVTLFKIFSNNVFCNHYILVHFFLYSVLYIHKPTILLTEILNKTSVYATLTYLSLKWLSTLSILFKNCRLSEILTWLHTVLCRTSKLCVGAWVDGIQFILRFSHEPVFFFFFNYYCLMWCHVVL